MHLAFFYSMNQNDKHAVHTMELAPVKTLSGEIRTEVIRKSIHILIALTPTLAGIIGQVTTMTLLGLGIMAYAVAELLRLRGVEVPVIGYITRQAMRSRDRNGIVLGPLTLGIGALLALVMYPEPASAIAIYALALGDGIASLVGKLFGTIRIPRTGGKSLEGSLACLLIVFVAATLVFPAMAVPRLALIALVATILELLPTKDLDNVIMPVGTGITAYLLMI